MQFIHNLVLRCFVARKLLSRIYALSSVKFRGLNLRLCKKNDKYVRILLSLYSLRAKEQDWKSVKRYVRLNQPFTNLDAKCKLWKICKLKKIWEVQFRKVLDNENCYINDAKGKILDNTKLWKVWIVQCANNAKCKIIQMAELCRV